MAGAEQPQLSGLDLDALDQQRTQSRDGDETNLRGILCHGTQLRVIGQEHLALEAGVRQFRDEAGRHAAGNRLRSRSQHGKIGPGEALEPGLYDTAATLSEVWA